MDQRRGRSPRRVDALSLRIGGRHPPARRTSDGLAFRGAGDVAAAGDAVRVRRLGRRRPRAPFRPRLARLPRPARRHPRSRRSRFRYSPREFPLLSNLNDVPDCRAADQISTFGEILRGASARHTSHVHRRQFHGRP